MNSNTPSSLGHGFGFSANDESADLDLITSWPQGLLQDDCIHLSQWFAGRMDAVYLMRTNISEAQRNEFFSASEANAKKQKPLFASPSKEMLSCTRFFSTIGLPWRWRSGAHSFLSGVQIESGALAIDPLASPSDVLHEAGHLACLAGDFRPLADGDLREVFRVMFERVNLMNAPTALAFATIQSGHDEAIAWAWAAGLHIGLPAEKIICDNDYNGKGVSIRIKLQTHTHSGIHGLAAAGFCLVGPVEKNTFTIMPVYPKLARWLQRDFRSISPSKSI